jgi:hypothetical protein
MAGKGEKQCCRKFSNCLQVKKAQCVQSVVEPTPTEKTVFGIAMIAVANGSQKNCLDKC